MLKLHRQILQNNILELHADWLEKEGDKVKAKECRKQAKLKQKRDTRQIEGFSERRRHERQVV